jgi:hypothetical protein
MSVMMMTFGLMPLGSVPAGILAEQVGAPPVVAISAGLFIVTALLIFGTIPAFRSLDGEIAAGRERVQARGAARPDEGLAPAPTAPVPGRGT